jgi:hypothetical protein
MTQRAPYGTEQVRLGSSAGTDLSWWETYKTHLAGINETSQRVIEDDAAFIVERGVFGAGPPSEGGWPASRERSGLVMGAVQSGKTASMMAVAAKALDQGIDAVIILGGTRTALWKQTHERIVEQLSFAKNPSRRRVLVPRDVSTAGSTAFLENLYQIPAQGISRAVRTGRPILAVVMKNWAHLQQFALVMQKVYDEAAKRDEPFHVLVIDDEADDSSVVDASTDAMADDIVVQRKQVPRRIVDIWERRRYPGQTANDKIFATYLAYTATPHANFLQDESNPLAPRDFVASLRTAGADGVPEFRTPTYRVPEGINDWYTGGDVYYRTLSAVPLCIPTDPIADNEQIPEAVRSFLVASAVRLWRNNGTRLGPLTASKQTFASKEEATNSSPEVATMLIHPSSGMGDHFSVAQELLGWAAGDVVSPASAQVDTQIDRQLSSVGIERDMATDPDRWTRWLEDYAQGASVIASYPEAGARPLPRRADWPKFRRLILDEVVPATSVRVINSHEDADDRPEFAPSLDGGTWRAARNLSTIFVSGNVMSRGLTLEGLTTTLFTRRSGTPFADTQMQMQRWFGYRGKYIELCRVFMPHDVLDNFINYHLDDEALHRDVLQRMASDDHLPDISVLQGRAYQATGKIANLRSQPLFPGSKPFIKHMNAPEDEDENLALIRTLFETGGTVVGQATRPRGLLLPRPVDLRQVADILDQLRYADHGPGTEGPEADRWRSLENHALLGPGHGVPLYRAPRAKENVDLAQKSPYWIAAYFRFWSACLVRRVPGVITTDDPPTRWDLVDLQTVSHQQPRFWIGLRFGDGAVLSEGPLAKLNLPVRPMKREVDGNDLKATWGSRGIQDGVIQGDDVFDYQARGKPADTTPAGDRKPGSDGLILFHPIDRGPGSVTVAVGMSIPLGGPDQIRAVPGGAW